MSNISVPRVVVTLTTMPERYDVLYKTLQSINKQDYKPDAIYLALPKVAKRLNIEYPPLPQKIKDLCNVVNVEDYGPITKLYGALVSEKDPDTIIISCDDDVIYDKTLISTLVKHSIENPNIAICGTGALLKKGLPLISMISSLQEFRKWNGLIGFDLDERGRAVDLIFGVAGVLYRRGFFPSTDKLEEELLSYTRKDISIFLNDDVLISGYLSKKNIKRYVFYDIPDVKCAENDKNALSANIFSMIKRLNTAINKVIEYGLFPTMEDVTVNETVAGKVIIAIILFAIIGILCICLIKL